MSRTEENTGKVSVKERHSGNKWALIIESCNVVYKPYNQNLKFFEFLTASVTLEVSSVLLITAPILNKGTDSSSSSSSKCALEERWRTVGSSLTWCLSQSLWHGRNTVPSDGLHSGMLDLAAETGAPSEIWVDVWSGFMLRNKFLLCKLERLCYEELCRLIKSYFWGTYFIMKSK